MNRLSPAVALLVAITLGGQANAVEKPNVILIVADDISAREFPIYGSNQWLGERARTPCLDRIANSGGCYVETAWAATICKPSRTMFMVGQYAHHTKWWDNAHIGNDCRTHYSPYASSPITLGTLSREAGYANIWVSKTRITDGSDVLSFGFHEAVFSPGEPSKSAWNPHGTPRPNPFPIFRSSDPKVWDHESSYWWPEIQRINHPDHPDDVFTWVETKVDDYAPDLELDHIFDFIARTKASPACVCGWKNRINARPASGNPCSRIQGPKDDNGKRPDIGEDNLLHAGGRAVDRKCFFQSNNQISTPISRMISAPANFWEKYNHVSTRVASFSTLLASDCGARRQWQFQFNRYDRSRSNSDSLHSRDNGT